MSKLAKLMEHNNVVVRDLGGNGILPANCICKGKLDFARVNDKTVLKCRDCGLVVQID